MSMHALFVLQNWIFFPAPRYRNPAYAIEPNQGNDCEHAAHDPKHVVPVRKRGRLNSRREWEIALDIWGSYSATCCKLEQHELRAGQNNRRQRDSNRPVKKIQLPHSVVEVHAPYASQKCCWQENEIYNCKYPHLLVHIHLGTNMKEVDQICSNFTVPD